MTDFPAEIAARTVWMEARGQGDEGMRAVAHVIVNRLDTERWGVTFALVCLAPFQFSCWNTADPNRKAMAALDDDDPALQKCRDFIEAALDGEDDPTKGSTHYYATSITPPAWVHGATFQVQIGRHVFYSNVP